MTSEIDVCGDIDALTLIDSSISDYPTNVLTK
jgi:hypothetical protein